MKVFEKLKLWNIHHLLAFLRFSPPQLPWYGRWERRLKAASSAGKVMATVFWDERGERLIEFAVRNNLRLTHDCVTFFTDFFDFSEFMKSYFSDTPRNLFNCYFANVAKLIDLPQLHEIFRAVASNLFGLSHFECVKELFVAKKCRIEWIASADNPADIMIKPLPLLTHHRIVRKITNSVTSNRYEDLINSNLLFVADTRNKDHESRWFRSRGDAVILFARSRAILVYAGSH